MTYIPQILFGDRLRLARRDAGLSQGDLAEILEVSRGRIGNWELGQHTPHSFELVEFARKIEAATGVAYEWLVLGDEPKEIRPPNTGSDQPRTTWPEAAR